MKRLPNFIIAGAAKAGTTSVYHYLNQHPDVFIPPKKECRFFSEMPGNFTGPGDELVNESIVRSIDDYALLFSEASTEKAIGDVSPDYLFYFQDSVGNIKNTLGNPKIIIILRNPAERAFSQYSHFLRDGRESLGFESALLREEERKRLNWEWAWRYKEVGFYYRQVKAYLDSFSEVKVYLYDDLKGDALGLMKNLYEFLGVDSSFTPDVGLKLNVSGVPQNTSLHGFLLDYDHPLKRLLRPLLLNTIGKARTERLVNYIKDRNAMKLKPETRRKLIEIYRDDILRLGRLIGRDLSNWLK